MNREFKREPEPSKQIASSNYLAYLFLISAAFIVTLPYLFPTLSGVVLVRSVKKENGEGKVNSNAVYTKGASPSSYLSLPPSDYAVVKRTYDVESRCDGMEALIVDLQRVVQNEREKCLHMEKEIRILQISEGFLKERVQYLEDKSLDTRRDLGAGYASSVELLLQNVQISEGKRANVDAIVQDLTKAMHTERERTASLEMEVRILQKTEAILASRIEGLENQLAALCKHTDVCNGNL